MVPPSWAPAPHPRAATGGRLRSVPGDGVSVDCDGSVVCVTSSARSSAVRTASATARYALAAGPAVMIVTRLSFARHRSARGVKSASEETMTNSS